VAAVIKLGGGDERIGDACMAWDNGIMHVSEHMDRVGRVANKWG